MKPLFSRPLEQGCSTVCCQERGRLDRGGDGAELGNENYVKSCLLKDLAESLCFELILTVSGQGFVGL